MKNNLIRLIEMFPVDSEIIKEHYWSEMNKAFKDKVKNPKTAAFNTTVEHFKQNQ